MHMYSRGNTENDGAGTADVLLAEKMTVRAQTLRKTSAILCKVIMLLVHVILSSIVHINLKTSKPSLDEKKKKKGNGSVT